MTENPDEANEHQSPTGLNLKLPEVYLRRIEERREAQLETVLEDPDVVARCIRVQVTQKSIVEGPGVGRMQTRTILTILEGSDCLSIRYTVGLIPNWLVEDKPTPLRA